VHEYTTPGSFNVSLNATNSSTGSNVATKIDYVTILATPPILPYAVITVNATSGDIPLTVDFNGNSVGGSPNSWLWNFGDGQTSTLQNPVHTYQAKGNYTINLTVSNSAGTTSRILQNWIRAGYSMVTVEESQNNSTIPLYQNNFIRVKLSDNPSTGYKWTLNVSAGLEKINETFIIDPKPTGMDGNGGIRVWDIHAAGIGEQTITGSYKRSWDPPGTGKVFSIIIYITSTISTPITNFTATPMNGTTPLTVIFTDTSTNTPTSWIWNFGDGNTTNATVQNPVHTYLTAGTYTVSLYATNSRGSNTTIITNFITATKPILPLPGMSQPPTDPDNDGIYEDLNGNNRIDFTDVVLYFNQMSWIAANEPIAAFDLNGNGRIDFSDTVVLFNEV